MDELRKEIEALGNKIQQMRDEFHANDGKWKDAEQRATFETVNKEYTDKKAEYDERKKVDDAASAAAEFAQASQRQTAPVDQGRADTSGAYTAEQRSADEAECLRSFLSGDQGEAAQAASQRCGLPIGGKSLEFSLLSSGAVRAGQEAVRRGRPAAEVRAAMSGFDQGTGGALTGSSFLAGLETNMLWYGGMLQAGEVFTTQTGERLPIPTADDTSNTGEQIGESQNIDNSGAGGPAPSTKAAYWNAYEYSSKAILVPSFLFEDSAFNLAAWIQNALAERLGRILNTKFTNGTGQNEPLGIVNAASAGNSSATANTIAYDDVINLKFQIDKAYRTPDAGFMCHDSIANSLRLLKNSNGDYLWTRGVDVGGSDRLDGSSLIINNDMTSTTTTNDKSLLYGQLSKYKIRRVRGVSFFHLPELYRASNQDGFIAILRADGNLLDAGTAPVKYLTIS